MRKVGLTALTVKYYPFLHILRGLRADFLLRPFGHRVLSAHHGDGLERVKAPRQQAL
jgi:hypothetical protein